LKNCIVKSAGHGVECFFSDQYITSLLLDACSFSSLKKPIWFTNSAAASSHTVQGCTFDGCGQIDPGDVLFTGNTISSSADALTGAILLDADGTSNWSDLSFVSGGTGHAIYITAPGSYVLDNLTYSGYGANDTTNAAIYNNSGGSVTLTVQGGSIPTVRNGAGASTTLVLGQVTLTIKAAVSLLGAEIRIYDMDGTLPNLGTELAGTETCPTATFAYTGSSGNEIWIQIMLDGYEEFGQAVTMPSANSDFVALLQADLNE
jgi:hypothetical protein